MEGSPRADLKPALLAPVQVIEAPGRKAERAARFGFASNLLTYCIRSSYIG